MTNILIIDSINLENQKKKGVLYLMINSFDIKISEYQAKKIAKANLLDLDVQVLYMPPKSNETRYIGKIVDKTNNRTLCQTGEIFFSEADAQTILHKIIIAIQQNDISEKFTVKICYNLKID